MKNLDSVSSVFFVYLSIAICLGAEKLPGGTRSNLGPMFFPFSVGFLER